jgi:tRNA(fMet)-specific endonuclease VapC
VSYVLDTNVVAALMRGEQKVVARLERVTRAMVAVPEPAWAEIAYGLARMPASRRRQRLMDRLELLRDELPSVVWSSEVSDAFGHLKASLEAKGQRLEDFDLAIAAHALAHDAVLVTANVRHLGRIDELEVEDWG